MRSEIIAQLVEELRTATPTEALAAKPTTLAQYLQVAGIAPPTPPPPEGKKAKKFAAKVVVTGSSNDLVQYGRVPDIHGRKRYAPPLAALPVEEPEGTKSFLRLLFTFGYGPLKLSDLRIGDTPIDAFTGVEYEIREGRDTDQPVTIYPDVSNDDLLDKQLTAAGLWVSRTTDGEVDSFAIDILFPDGLVKFNTNGTIAETSVKLRFQYRLVGSAWPAKDNIPALTVKEKTRSAFTRSVKVSVPRGKYEIQVLRATADSTSDALISTTKWSALRSFKNGNPVTLSGLCLVAMRIQATQQLSGIVDKFTALAERYLLDWNGSSWAERLTRNAAASFRYLLQGKANKRPYPDSRLDLAAIQAWADANTAAGRNFDFVFDDEGALEERLRFVAAAGRASLGMPGGKFSVVRDVAQTTPRQVFSPANSWGFRASKVFKDQPHALKVAFVNPDQKDADDERLVYDDGYSAANATKFERIELPWCTSADTAWKEGRYHIAVGRLRPEVLELEVDFEHFPVTRGDLVRANHDVILVGTGHGRLTAVTVDGGGNCTSVRVDNAVTMESAKTYAMGIRRSTLAYVVGAAVLNVGEQTTVSFSPAIPAASAPAVGDLFVFGEAGKESAEYLVQSIRMLSGFAARLTLVDASPGVHQAESGTIPGYDPKITQPPVLAAAGAVSPPQVQAVQSSKDSTTPSPQGAFKGIVALTLKKGGTKKKATKLWVPKGRAK